MNSPLRKPGRLLVLVSLLATAVSAACGAASSSAAPPKPSPSPITAASVADAARNSTMKSGHFTVTGTVVYQAKPYAATGVGVIDRVPAALQVSVKIDTKTSLGVVQYEQIDIAGVKYYRIGTAAWHSSPSTFGPNDFVPTKYMGEETVNGVKCWHAQAVAVDGGTYDFWVKESDGYIPKVVYTGTDGSGYTMIVDSYNTTPPIGAPTGA
jgi:hypothetical protein